MGRRLATAERSPGERQPERSLHRAAGGTAQHKGDHVMSRVSSDPHVDGHLLVQLRDAALRCIEGADLMARIG